jgi:uroporphyrinogen decarboxylase
MDKEETTVVELPASAFNRLVLNSHHRLAMPIATYPGLALTGARMRDVVTNAQAQLAAQAALHARYDSPFVMSAMDLSVEAEAFGCTIQMSDTEIPTVTGRRVTNQEEAKNLAVPAVGDKRTRVYLETVRGLSRLTDRPLVLGGCIGPFSLAARLAGVSEAMELTVTEPELMHVVLEKSSAFLMAYATAFRAAGAHGLIMAEPAAGLLSPRGLATFSSAYVKRVNDAMAGQDFFIVLHNCGARFLHLTAILETGLSTFHFGAPMDLAAALGQVAPNVVLCGNLDPAGVFCQLVPTEVSARVTALLHANAAHRNFVISSGCDVPPNASLANLDAFYRTVSSSQPK